MRVAAYQAPLLAAGSMEALGLGCAAHFTICRTGARIKLDLARASSSNSIPSSLAPPRRFRCKWTYEMQSVESGCVSTRASDSSLNSLLMSNSARLL